jgi:Fic family protein
MNPEDFKAPAAGKVIRHGTGYHAFIPAALPPLVNFDADLVLMLSKADAALSELSGLGHVLPNPHLLIGPLLRREAVQSSRIEGTQASLSDVLLDEATPAQSATPKSDDLREVRNYVTALEHGITRLGELPLSLRLVRELHGKLMAGVRGDQATPGEFRRTQNWIGPAGSNLMNAPYVPPPVDEMTELLADWERYLHLHDRTPDLVQCAIMHEQFEAIHPFLDGNGRVGRLMITLFLIERGRLSRPLLYLSDFIERHRQDYYDLLQRVRTHGEWIPWIRYFLTGVGETARDAATRARRLLELREAMMRHTDHALVDRLLTNPYVSIAQAAQAMDVSQPTANKEIQRLEAAGVLRKVTPGNWGKIYLATAVLAAIESTAEPPAASG